MPHICGKGSMEDDRSSHTIQNSVKEYKKWQFILEKYISKATK